jgi:hypothetical protein
MPRSIAIALAVCVACLGADKKPAEGMASSEAVQITARAYTDRQEIKQLIGYELDDSISVVEVRLVPKDGKKLSVVWDDFTLRSDKDGQHSTPFAPSQIAGSSALVLTSSRGPSIGADPGDPVWGPPTGGRPRRLGGNGGAVGTSPDAGQPAAKVETTAGQDPLLAALKAKVLPEKETTEPLSGLLYFYLEGKLKPKDLELRYQGSAGKLSLRFKPTSLP